MRVNLTEAQALSGELQFAAYACLDTTGTREIFDVLYARLTPKQKLIYEWSLAQQSPAVAMGLRGVRVDEATREQAIVLCKGEVAAAVFAVQAHPLVARWDGFELETGLCDKNVVKAKKSPRFGKPSRHKWPRAEKGGSPLDPKTMACLACGAPRTRPAAFEPSSADQCRHLFYDILRVPPIRNKDGNITCNKDALEKIGREGVAKLENPTPHKKKGKLPGLSELVRLILTHRTFFKQLGFLSARLSPDQRYPSSFNVGAAWTGRWSSSKSPFQEGGNLQNITEKYRHIFLPDVGMKMGYADLKTAESLEVAYMSGDEKYIEAHKGDVHTFVCREVWPHLPWTGDIKKDKKIAQNANPDWDKEPGHDYRFQSKRVQHGSNYGLTPFGMAIIAHIPVGAADYAQSTYFEAFPMIPEWQKWVTGQVEQSRTLYNPLDRSVSLFGRPKDPHTRKQGLAFGPQSAVGDVLNLGLWQLWRQCDPGLIQLLAQVHDAILFQYNPKFEIDVLKAIAGCMHVEVPVTDIRGVTRTCAIQVEVAVGQNWGKAGPSNPNGLVEIGLPKVSSPVV